MLNHLVCTLICRLCVSPPPVRSFARSQHRALSCYVLGAFRECEVTSLSLGGCRGVRNGWVRNLLENTPCGTFIVSLDLSGCSGLTDTYVFF